MDFSNLKVSARLRSVIAWQTQTCATGGFESVTIARYAVVPHAVARIRCARLQF